MSDEKRPTGWYESENGVVFHALSEDGMSQETLEVLGKMADAAQKMQADKLAAFQAMADDPTVDQAAWQDLADKVKAEMSGNLRCSICGAEARWRVCPRCKGAGCTSEDCPCICCDGEGGEWVCDCDEEKP